MGLITLINKMIQSTKIQTVRTKLSDHTYIAVATVIIKELASFRRDAYRKLLNYNLITLPRLIDILGEIITTALTNKNININTNDVINQIMNSPEFDFKITDEEKVIINNAFCVNEIIIPEAL